MTTNELHERIEELRKRAWSVWADAHQLPRDCGTDDMCFLASGGIKTLTLEVVDNLVKVERFLRRFCIDPAPKSMPEVSGEN